MSVTGLRCLELNVGTLSETKPKRTYDGRTGPLLEWNERQKPPYDVLLLQETKELKLCCQKKKKKKKSKKKCGDECEFSMAGREASLCGQEVVKTGIKTEYWRYSSPRPKFTNYDKVCCGVAIFVRQDPKRKLTSNAAASMVDADTAFYEALGKAAIPVSERGLDREAQTCKTMAVTSEAGSVFYVPSEDVKWGGAGLVAALVSFGDSSFLFISVYRHRPRGQHKKRQTEQDECLRSAIEALMEKHLHAIPVIAGDFNFTEYSQREVEPWLSFFETHEALNSETTQDTGATKSVLDLVICRKDDKKHFRPIEGADVGTGLIWSRIPPCKTGQMRMFPGGHTFAVHFEVSGTPFPVTPKAKLALGRAGEDDNGEELKPPTPAASDAGTRARVEVLEQQVSHLTAQVAMLTQQVSDLLIAQERPPLGAGVRPADPADIEKTTEAKLEKPLKSEVFFEEGDDSSKV